MVGHYIEANDGVLIKARKSCGAVMVTIKRPDGKSVSARIGRDDAQTCRETILFGVEGVPRDVSVCVCGDVFRVSVIQFGETLAACLDKSAARHLARQLGF